MTVAALRLPARRVVAVRARSDWSLVWRVPCALVLGAVALACFLADDVIRLVKR